MLRPHRSGVHAPAKSGSPPHGWGGQNLVRKQLQRRMPLNPFIFSKNHNLLCARFGGVGVAHSAQLAKFGTMRGSRGWETANLGNLFFESWAFATGVGESWIADPSGACTPDWPGPNTRLAGAPPNIKHQTGCERQPASICIVPSQRVWSTLIAVSRARVGSLKSLRKANGPAPRPIGSTIC